GDHGSEAGCRKLLEMHEVWRRVERHTIAGGSSRHASLAVTRPRPQSETRRHACRGETATEPDFKSIESGSFDIASGSARFGPPCPNVGRTRRRPVNAGPVRSHNAAKTGTPFAASGQRGHLAAFSEFAARPASADSGTRA